MSTDAGQRNVAVAISDVMGRINKTLEANKLSSKVGLVNVPRPSPQQAIWYNRVYMLVSGELIYMSIMLQAKLRKCIHAQAAPHPNQ